MTVIYVPWVMARIMCCSDWSFGRNGGSHVCCYNCGCFSVLVIPVPKHFTVQLLTLSVLVFSELVGSEGIEFPIF